MHWVPNLRALCTSNVQHHYPDYGLTVPHMDNLFRMSLDRRSAAPLQVAYLLKSFLMKGIDSNND